MGVDFVALESRADPSIRSAGDGGVTVNVQGLNAVVTYAGPQRDFPGLDQVNVLLPLELAGSGEVNIVLAAAAVNANRHSVQEFRRVYYRRAGF